MSAVLSSAMPHNRRYQSMQALGLAILIEAAIVVGAVVILVGTTPVKSALSDAVPITLTEEPPPEKPPEPKPVPPVPVPQPKVKAVVKPAQPKPPTPQPPQQETPPVTDAPSDVAAATAFTQPAVAAPPPPPPPPASGRADAKATYADKVNAAVRVSHRSNYPAAAAMTHFPGEAQVEFHLRDGILLGEPRILESCGKGIFDQSALQAVRLAHYPEPPNEFRGEELLMKVWVQFEH